MTRTPGRSNIDMDPRGSEGTGGSVRQAAIRVLGTMLLLLAVAIGSAAQAAEGIGENPHFTRLPGFSLHDTADNTVAAYDFFDGKNLVRVQGRLYRSDYYREKGAAPVKGLQISRDFENEIRRKGGTVLCVVTASGVYPDARRWARSLLTGKVRAGNREMWVEVWPSDEFDGNYRLTVVEVEAGRAAPAADGLAEALKREGRVVLPIAFDAGKATIRKESLPVIARIARILSAEPSLSVSIEGHTDNAGDSKRNRKLSLDRARAVRAALVAKGIGAKRLSAAGFGPDRPIADNASDDGRAKNRRIEMVRK